VRRSTGSAGASQRKQSKTENDNSSVDQGNLRASTVAKGLGASAARRSE
jgi:hypothetical protein